MILLLWLTQRNCWYFAIVSLPTKFNSDTEISELNIYYISCYVCICHRCLFQYLHLLSLRFFMIAFAIVFFLIFASAIVAFSNICLCHRCLAGEIVGDWCVSRPIKKGGAALPCTQSAVIRKTNKQTKLEATWMGSLIRKKQISDSVYCGQYLYIISYIFYTHFQENKDIVTEWKIGHYL